METERCDNVSSPAEQGSRVIEPIRWLIAALKGSRETGGPFCFFRHWPHATSKQHTPSTHTADPRASDAVLRPGAGRFGMQSQALGDLRWTRTRTVRPCSLPPKPSSTTPSACFGHSVASRSRSAFSRPWPRSRHVASPSLVARQGVAHVIESPRVLRCNRRRLQMHQIPRVYVQAMARAFLAPRVQSLSRWDYLLPPPDPMR